MASLKQQIQHFLLQESGRTPRIPVLYTLSTKIHKAKPHRAPQKEYHNVNDVTADDSVDAELLMRFR